MASTMRPFWLSALLVCVAVLMATGTPSAATSTRQPVPDSRATLVPGETVEGRGQPREEHVYVVLLDRDDFVELEATQDTAELSVQIADPAGRQRRYVQTPSSQPHAERTAFIADTDGPHRITVRLESRGGTGDQTSVYHIRVVARRPAADADRRRVALFDRQEAATTAANQQSLARYGAAIDDLLSLAAEWRADGDRERETALLKSVSSLAGMFSQFSLRSVEAHQRLIPLYEDRAVLQLQTAQRLSNEFYEAGRLVEARAAAADAAALARRRGNIAAEAAAVRFIGYLAAESGDYDEARRRGQQALEMALASDLREVASWTHFDLANLDGAVGDFDGALRRFHLGLEQAQSETTRNYGGLGLGLLHLRRGEWDLAEARLRDRLVPGRRVQREQEATARLGLGDVLKARGDLAGARGEHQRALELLLKGAPGPRVCLARARAAEWALTDGDTAAAAIHLDALADVGERYLHPQCDAEAHRGRVAVAIARGDLAAAETHARRLIDATERLRLASTSADVRALGFGAHAPAYALAIDVLMRQAAAGMPTAAARALELHERSLARGLLDQMSATPASSRAPAALAAARATALERWRSALATLAFAIPNAPDTVTDARATAERLRLELADRDAALARAEGRLAPLGHDAPLSVTDLQSHLEAGTVLLEFALGDRTSVLWVVTADAVQAHELPGRAAIAPDVRALLDALAVAPGAANRPQTAAVLDRLGRTLLGPASPALAAARHVVVVPGGGLSLLPFASVPASFAGGAPLGEVRVVSMAPSLSVVAAVRRAAREAPSDGLAIFADPIFGPDDPRRRGGPRGTTAGNAARFPALPRLLFSRREGRSIAALAPGARRFFDADASRTNATGDALRRYRYLHFATHGVADGVVPALSRIALSFVDAAGQPQDGWLMLADVQQMRLSADMVVLSACDTVSGREVQGEGPLGLARGFLGAGAARVVASLWPVDDQVTARLMTTFYRHLLVDERRPAEALASAQREIRATTRWRDPYYWAGFTLIGEWR